MRLKDSVAIVTGAGNGIGRGIAKEFAKQGATVVIATLVPEEGEFVANEIRNEGGKVLFVQTDVTSEDSICSMVEQVMECYGKIDTLVNNAGITAFKPLIEVTVEDWEKLMNVDLRGVFLCCKYVIPEMIKSHSGSIINISSGHTVATLPDTEMYAAAKSGVNGMTRSMALSYGSYGIRANVICPGFTNTPYYQKWLLEKESPDLVEQEVISLHPINRIIEPQDIAQLAVYLASDESQAMTGSILVLDGGVSARLFNSKIF